MDVAMGPEMHLGAPAGVPSRASRGRLRRRDVAPLLAWIGCLVAALALLQLLGGGQLAAPDLTAPSTWSAWVAARTSAEVAVSLLRIVALALAWYLLGITTVSVLARVLRAARLVRIADALSVGPVRHLVQQALGLSLAAGVLTATVPADVATAGGTVTAAPIPPATVVAAPADAQLPQPAGVVDAPQLSVTEGAVEVLVPIPVPAPEPVAATSPEPGHEPAATEPAASTTEPAASTTEPAAAAGLASPATGQRTVTVAPGDHLWSLAATDVAAVLGRAPTDAEIIGHWGQVVAANAANLVVPGNPDLLRPGQTIVLPAVRSVVAP